MRPLSLENAFCIAPATKSAHGGSQIAAPATKSDEWCMMSGGLTSGDEWCMMSDVNVRNTEVPSKLPLIN